MNVRGWMSAGFRAWSTVGLAGLVALASARPVAAQNTHTDARLGFELKMPREWKPIPIRADERWIVAKYESEEKDRAMDTQDKRQSWYLQPQVRVIAFPDQPAARKSEKKGKDTYRDYPSYLKGTYPMGFFIANEEATTHADLPVTCFEVKVEETNGHPGLRLDTWVYETDIGKIAVEFEYWPDSYKKFKSTVRRTLKSFKVIPRTEAAEASADAAPSVASLNLAALTPAERKKRRIEAQEREWDEMKAALPKKSGWKAKKMSGVYVLNHADDSYAKDVVKRVKAVMDWLEDTFPKVGPTEYARPPLIRICRDESEENSFRSGSGTFSVDGTHLVTHQAPRAKTTTYSGRSASSNAWEWEYVAARTLQIWFLERDRALWLAMPKWIQDGLLQVASASTAKGSKLEFGEGDLEKFRWKDAPDRDERMSTDRLLKMTQSEYESLSQADSSTWLQSVALTRFLITARTKKYRELLPNYLSNVRRALEQFDAEHPPITTKEAKNEAEEDKLVQERRARRRARERAVLDRAFAWTFEGWDKGDWQSFERAFGRSL